MTHTWCSSVASRVLTLLTVAGVVATTRAVVVGQEQRINAAEDTVTISGRVVDPDRKPVVEASVGTYSIGDDAIHLKTRASSDTQGKFKFPIAKSELDGGPFKVVVAQHKDFGMAVTELADLSKTEDILLRLVENTPIQGRIIDSQGKPVADAQISIEFAAAIRDENFAAYVAALRNEKRAEAAKAMEGRITFWPEQTVPFSTDKDGRFELKGIGPSRIVRLAMRSKTTADDRLNIVVGAEKLSAQEGPFPVYGATFEHVAKPARKIGGIVRDKESGKPLAGITISSFPSTHRPKTDADGRFAIQGVARADEYVVQAIPLDGQPYFVNGASVPDAQGRAPLEVEIVLHKGLLLKGRLTDKATGEPIKAQISYHPLNNNPHFAGQTGWAAPGGSVATGSLSYPSTQSEDGSFTIPVFPGPGVIACRTSNNAYDSASVDPSTFFRDGKDYGDAASLKLAPLRAGMGPLETPQSQYQAIRLINPDSKNPDSLKAELVVTRKRATGGGK